MTELEYVNCDLCGRDDTTQLYQIEKLSIVQCNRCGLVYTNPRLDESERIKFYGADFFTAKDKDYFNYIENPPGLYTIAQLRLKGIARHKNHPGRC